MRFGVFGGTFDPIHVGHLVVAEEARILLKLDEVVFIPAGRPWLRAGQQIAKPEHRMAMVERAVESNPYFRASDMEIKRPGVTYTLDTLLEMRRELGPAAVLYLILGLDSLKDLIRWREPERILDLCTVVGMSRPGFEGFDLRALDAIAPGTSDRVRLLTGPLIGISGTELRRRVSCGLPIRYRVPESVEAYIYEHGLYRAQP